MQNSGTEMLGAFLTFVLLELIRGRRERKAQEQAEEQRTKATQELVRGFIQAQEIARLRAARTPEERQPILDAMWATKLLQGANLHGVDLHGAKIRLADLQGALLYGATLQGADLRYTDLQGADLSGANLHRANLQGASLDRANLQKARSLTREQLKQARTLQGTILPDGTKLPDDDTWRNMFEVWCETVETETGPLGEKLIRAVDEGDNVDNGGGNDND